MSAFQIHGRAFPAFSGLDSYVNKRSHVCVANKGAIPFGTYYIIDRESGGILGAIHERIRQQSGWFALYAADGKIDDYTFCNEILRGNFRLHPKTGLGVSKGCITVNSMSDFLSISAMLRSSVSRTVRAAHGKPLKVYGQVVVR